MGSTSPPEELKAFMDLLNTPLVVERPPEMNEGGLLSPNMLQGTGIKFIGHLVQWKKVHIQVLLGAKAYFHLEDEMTARGLEFEMDVYGWQRPD